MQTEACDQLEGFLLLQSMAGGTGAGLGTRTAEVLRDEFGLVPSMNACVWPHEGGEVLVQSYNTLLTLTHLAQVGASGQTSEHVPAYREPKHAVPAWTRQS